MGKSSELSRRQVQFDDSDEEETKSSYQPVSSSAAREVALADLSNAARDRQTAHDIECDRPLDQARINQSRKCNQQWTPEAEIAAEKQTEISAWNNVASEDGVLANIANGQYHRLNTQKRMEEEKRQLRAHGRPVDAASIDAHRAPRVLPTRSGQGSQNYGQGHISTSTTKQKGSLDRPLDPAVDPNRTYSYKNGRGYSRDGSQPVRGQPATRGGRQGTRAGHATISARRSTVQLKATQSAQHKIYATSKETTSAGDANGRASSQRQEHSASQLASTPVASKFKSKLKASEIIVEPVQKANDTTSQSAGIRQIAIPKSRVRKHANASKLADPDTFFSALNLITYAEPTKNQQPPDIAPKLVEEQSTQPVLVPRHELAQASQTAAAAAEDDHTDGQPTPTVLSDIHFSSSSNNASNGPEFDGLGISGLSLSEPSQSDITSSQKSTTAQDLLGDDDQASILKDQVLSPEKSPLTYIEINGRYFFPAPEGFKPSQARQQIVATLNEDKNLSKQHTSPVESLTARQSYVFRNPFADADNNKHAEDRATGTTCKPMKSASIPKGETIHQLVAKFDMTDQLASCVSNPPFCSAYEFTGGITSSDITGFKPFSVPKHSRSTLLKPGVGDMFVNSTEDPAIVPEPSIMSSNRTTRPCRYKNDARAERDSSIKSKWSNPYKIQEHTLVVPDVPTVSRVSQRTDTRLGDAITRSSGTVKIPETANKLQSKPAFITPTNKTPVLPSWLVEKLQEEGLSANTGNPANSSLSYSPTVSAIQITPDLHSSQMRTVAKASPVKSASSASAPKLFGHHRQAHETESDGSEL